MDQSPPFPSQVLSDTSYWARFLGDEWVRDFPTQIHGTELGDDGRPRWHADFAHWVTNAADEERHRTTRVMRKLRRAAPREYEVSYRAMILGESFEEITRWLNERALRNNIPLPPGRTRHYRLKDCVALFICAIDYARFYW